MRFKESPSRPPYLNTRDQMRMLGLVGLLVLVLIAMKVAANPKTWSWMFPEGQPAQRQDRSGTPAKESIDFNVRLEEDKSLPPGAFQSGARADSSASDPASQSAEPADAAKPSPRGRAAESGENAVEVDPSLLSGIRDNTIGVRRDEADAFYTLLAKIREPSLNTLERLAQDEVTFTVLMVDSDHFRGKLVTLEGQIKRLTRLPAALDSHELERLYEFWMLTADSGTNPIRVVCTELPEGIPRGESIEEPVKVRVTGYFFKREGYASQGGLHVAPLILAKRPRWLRPPASVPVEHGLAPWLVGLLLLIASAFGVTIWRLSARDHALHREHLRQLTEAPQEAIRALDDVEVSDPAEVFRQLSDGSPATDDDGGETREGE